MVMINTSMELNEPKLLKRETSFNKGLKQYTKDNIPCRIFQDNDEYSYLDTLQPSKLNKEKPVAKHIIVYNFLIREINSLKNYRILIKYYMSLLDIFADKYFPEYNRDFLFGNLLSIYECGAKFWHEHCFKIFKDLDAQYVHNRKGKETSNFVDVFQNFDQHLEPFINYIINVRHFKEYLEHMSKKYPHFGEIIKHCDQMMNKLDDFGGLLTNPYQKFFHYVSDFNDLRKRIKKESTRRKLDEISNKGESLLKEINTKITKADLRNKLSTLNGVMKGFKIEDCPRSRAISGWSIRLFDITDDLNVSSQHNDNIRRLITYENAHMMVKNNTVCDFLNRGVGLFFFLDHRGKGFDVHRRADHLHFVAKK